MTSSWLHLFRWHVLRYVAHHRLLAVLNVLSVALGVAVYLAIQIANHSAVRSFAATIDLVAGKADLQITAPAGNLRDEILPLVARQPAIAAVTPLVRGFVTLPDFPGEYLQVLGVDIFTNEPFRTFELTDFSAGEFDVQRWLRESNSIAISEEFARSRRLNAGDTVRAQVNGEERRLRIAFIMRSGGGAAPDAHFAAMDIGWAQELFARRGRLTEVQLRLQGARKREDVVAELRALLPPDVTIASPAQRGEQVQNMLGGFQLNLTAMSLVSLLVGMFLIYNTVSASVVRRRHEIGVLRSLGATRNEVRALFLSEALALGAVGALVGLLAGLLLARVLVGTVAETISSLYVLLSVRQTSLTPWMFVSAAVIGLGSVLAAAWLPAASAAKMHPVRALQGDSLDVEATGVSPTWLLAGFGAIGAAVVLSYIALTTGPRWIGFGAAFCVLTGFSFLVPSITAGFSRGSGRLGRSMAKQSVEANLAAANLGRSLMRNSVTIVALAAAVAMTIGVSVMVFSFRRTIESWIDQTLAADLFIAPASNEVVGPSSFIPPEAIGFLEAHPAVAAIDTFREIDVPFGNDAVAVAVIRGGERRRFRFLRGDDTTIMRRFYEQSCIVVSESFARKKHVREGEAIELRTPDGPRQFPIAGVFYDYTRDEGVIYMSTSTFLPVWKDDRVNSVAVYLKPGRSAEELTTAFRAKFSGAGQFMMLSNRELRTRIFAIFDQTFAVTYVLRTIAVIVAVVGICLTLTTLIAERSRDLGVLRAIGASAKQIRRLLLWESAMIGLLAAVVGLASGLCLSVVLTGVINRAFFGWTIQLAFPWLSLALTPVWIVAAAVTAGILPAWRAGRLPLAEALRSE